MCHEGRNVGKWEQNNISPPLICTTYMDAYISQLSGTDPSRTCCTVLCLKKYYTPQKISSWTDNEYQWKCLGSMQQFCHSSECQDDRNSYNHQESSAKQQRIKCFNDYKLEKPISYNSIFLLKLRKSLLSMKSNYCELQTRTFHLFARSTYIHSYSKPYKQNIMQQINGRLQYFFHSTRFDY